MCAAAPEDPPYNLSVWNVTSKSVSVSWDPPTIVTGRFSYVTHLYGPTGTHTHTHADTHIYSTFQILAEVKTLKVADLTLTLCVCVRVYL